MMNVFKYLKSVKDREDWLAEQAIIRRNGKKLKKKWDEYNGKLPVGKNL